MSKTLPCLKCDGGTAAVHSDECWQQLKDENTTLRAISSKHGCVYGMQSESGGCQLGYPGCACADDLLIFDTERSAKVGSALQKIRGALTYLETLPLITTTQSPEYVQAAIKSAAKLIATVREAVDSLSSEKRQG